MLETPTNRKCTYQNYEVFYWLEAIRLVRDLKMTIYKASKQAGIPWNHLNRIGRKVWIQHPTEMPNKSNFRSILNLALISSFSGLNIRNAFRKFGTYPLSKNVVPKQATAPSLFTAFEQDNLNDAVLNEEGCDGQGNILTVPQQAISCTALKSSIKNRLKREVLKYSSRYSEDFKQKNRAKWVQCSYCLVTYHVNYQKEDSVEQIFMCDIPPARNYIT